MILQQTIQMTEPSLKHKQYAKNVIDYINGYSDISISIAEGSVRSGKTVDHCFLAAVYLEICPDRIHLASGSSVHNAKLNIGDCNGFGLEYLFKGRCKWGKYKDNEALIIQTQTGEKIVIFAGGGKADSYKGILGNSYGMWIATEINEHYDSDDSRTSFMYVAQARQIAALKPFTLWDLNPCNPQHPIYSKYIDKYRDDGLANYGHFTLHDNASLTEERIAEVTKRYTEGTVAYNRDILGMRTVAEGLIYSVFADNEQDFYIDNIDNMRFIKILVGIDFGKNKSKHAFTAIGITAGFKDIIVLKAIEKVAKDTTPEHIYQVFNEFQTEIKQKYKRIDEVYADSAEQTMINGMRANCCKNIYDSDKGRIMDRIKATLIFMSQRRLKLLKNECTALADAFKSSIYDPKKYEDERLDNGTVPIDILDSFEYAWNFYSNALTGKPQKQR